MAKILILFTHPLLEKSRIHVELLHSAKTVEGVTINDLYQNYPDFDIDVEREKKLLSTHDVIIWQHPLYWYSAPALLKQWLDLVLEHGWAYGRSGHALSGKKVFNVISSGGSAQAYQPGDHNRYSIREFLKPFEQTAALCRMTYLPPFWVSGVHTIEKEQIDRYAHYYRKLLAALNEDLMNEKEINQIPLLNDLLSINSPKF